MFHPQGGEILLELNCFFYIQKKNAKDWRKQYEKEQKFRAEYNLNLKWNDSRLLFCNVENAKETALKEQEIAKVWTPIVKMKNTAELEKILFDPDSLVSVNSDFDFNTRQKS